MKTNNIVKTPQRFLHLFTLLGALIAVWLLLATTNTAHAKDSLKLSTIINKSTSAIVLPNSVLNNVIDDCGDEDYCEALAAFCKDEEQCALLIDYCIENPEDCESVIRFIVCEFEGGENCTDEPACQEGDEDCTSEPACNEEDEECIDEPVCNEDNEDCSQPPICHDEEEAECDQVVSTGFENTNPIADTTIKAVSKEKANHASRFLSQATLGANYPLVTQVAAMGESQWLENQFEQPIGYLFPQIDFLLNKVGTFENEEMEEIYGSPLKFHMHAWWTQAMTSPDLVRQRVAMALSEIFVISSNVEILGESPYAISHYYDTLLTHSLGNFRDLLKDISLNPAMAIYLSHMNNEKANPETGTFPDENYAREVMQLFSIGLFELNIDGSRKKDNQGQDIPTYGQPEIREFAKIFTGLSMDNPEEGFGAVPCCNGDFYPHAAELKPLKMYDAFHSTGEKKLLNGLVVPSGQTGMQDFEMAIDNLFNHPNVGPFIGKQLIQRLVTSNPSPAYISRVASAFNGTETGVRGDMKATIRAILLDPEARLSLEDNPAEFGKLREPFLRLVRLARTFNATTPDRNFAGDEYDVARQLKQYVFNAPSVFNFFQPGYSPNGEIKDAGLVAPEFQITNGVTIIEIKNLIDLWVDTAHIGERVGYLAPQTVSFEHELALANDVDALITHLDTLMTYGTLSANSRNAIKTVLEGEPEALDRVKKAVYLIAVSPDYAVAL